MCNTLYCNSKEHFNIKGQGPRRVIFGPVKSQNMTQEEILLVIIFVTYDSLQFQMGIEKNLTAPFHEFSMPQRVAKTLKT